MKRPAKTLEQWFQEYSASHQNKKNKIIHKVCVPLIFFSVIGFLLLIPFQIGTIYIGEIIITLLLFWYLSLGFKVFAVMLVQVVICHVLLFVLAQITPPLFPLLGIFILAWIGQFVGHKIEGQKPSFFKDLQFLLIGPLWVIRGLFS